MNITNRPSLAADAAALDELLADSLLYTHSNGAVDTKASFIDALTSGRLKYRAVRRLEADVKTYEHAAIVGNFARRRMVEMSTCCASWMSSESW